MGSQSERLGLVQQNHLINVLNSHEERKFIHENINNFHKQTDCVENILTSSVQLYISTIILRWLKYNVCSLCGNARDFVEETTWIKYWFSIKKQKNVCNTKKISHQARKWEYIWSIRCSFSDSVYSQPKSCLKKNIFGIAVISPRLVRQKKLD